MKKYLPLILGVGLLAFYWFSKNRKAAAPRISTTGTANRAPTDAIDALLGTYSRALGGQANRVVYGSSGGGANGADLTPLIKAGAGALGDLAKNFYKKIFGGTGDADAPGKSVTYGSQDYGISSPIWDGTPYGIQNDEWFNTTYGTGSSSWSDLENARNDAGWQIDADETWSGSTIDASMGSTDYELV